MGRRLAVVAAVIGTALIGTGGALADDGGAEGGSAVPLTGEIFITSEAGDPGTSTVTGTCDPLGTSTFTFVVTGVAIGPYPGTFREEGTFSFGPFGVPEVGFAPAAFEASFTIQSAAGTVTGTKTLTPPGPNAFGACGEFVFGGTEAGATMFAGPVSYKATITTPSGTASDQGEGWVDYGDSQLRGQPDGNGFAFSETFASTSFIPGGGADDDDDDGGGDG